MSPEKQALIDYPPPKGCGYYPHEGFSYQCNLRNHDRFSMLKDDEVSQLVKSVRTGAKLMRWRLQHFTDRHVNELLELLRLGAVSAIQPVAIAFGRR